MEIKMVIPVLSSVKKIEKQYETGERPVLVMCSDLNAYICKYKHSSNAAYKLVCEFVGAQMASAWQLKTPEIAFINIKSNHSNNRVPKCALSVPSLGYKLLKGVVDINSSNYIDVCTTTSVIRQLMKIALFDYWIANEDRNVNNANLLYDVRHGRLISIDYGCVLNNADFDGGMSLLTSNESILSSDLFQHISLGKDMRMIDSIIDELSMFFEACINRCKRRKSFLLENIPEEWGVPKIYVENKIGQLLDDCWCREVWVYFVENVKDNIDNGKFEI